MSTVGNAIRLRSLNGLQDVVDAFNKEILPGAILRYNSDFGRNYLLRREDEALPQDPRQLAGFRTRLGLVIEYALGLTINEFLRAEGEGMYLTFVVNNQYPDFYVRDTTNANAILLRIDSKTLHDESAEKSARFDLPTAQVAPLDDLLMYIAWKWEKTSLRDSPIIYPHILEGLFVPAIEIAEERDRHLTLRGGHVDSTGVPRVPPHENRDTNYGKINRIIHERRQTASDLNPNVRAFLDFTKRHAEAVARAASGRSETASALTGDETLPGDASGTSDPTTET